MDFPTSPFIGQLYTAPSGVTYAWDGTSWQIGFYDNTTQNLMTLGSIIQQIRTLLQDTDLTSGQFRYSTDSIVTALNQAMLDMFRIRPDLFLEASYIVPVFNVADLEVDIGVEHQYLPPFIYYAVGLVQARDDEQNQDQRAFGFLQVFQKSIVSGGLV